MSNNPNGTSVLPYNGTNITFELANGDVMVNLTEMGKAFGKRPNDFLTLPSTNQLINAITRKSGIDESQVVSTIRGGANPGTWANRLVALSFAQWLSVDFHLICLEKIEELLTTGVATISNDDEVIAQAMSVLQKRLESSKQRVQMLEGENEQLMNEIKQLAPKAQYTDEVLQSTSTFTANQIAKDLGMSAISLNKWLNQMGVQYKESGQWLLYYKYQNKGYVDTRVSGYTNRKTGEIETTQSTVWTERGRKFIIELYNKIANRNTQIMKGATV